MVHSGSTPFGCSQGMPAYRITSRQCGCVGDARAIGATWMHLHCLHNWDVSSRTAAEQSPDPMPIFIKPSSTSLPGASQSPGRHQPIQRNARTILLSVESALDHLREPLLLRGWVWGHLATAHSQIQAASLQGKSNLLAVQILTFNFVDSEVDDCHLQS